MGEEQGDRSIPGTFGGVAVITGAAGGIGTALARMLAARDCRLALIDLSAEKAKALAASIGAEARGYGCDVSDNAAVEAVAQAVQNDLGPVNLLFANAGVAVGGKLFETSADEFRWMFDVNVFGAFATVSAFTPQLRAQAATGAQSRIVLTGSENSVGLPETAEMTAYTATKHAILAMADGLRRDLADDGVGVHVLCPGVVATRIWDGRAYRQDRYGGALKMSEEIAENLATRIRANGQDPEVTARLCLEGIERGEFLIITDPKIRSIAESRNAEVAQALNTLDRRLAETGLPAFGVFQG